MLLEILESTKASACYCLMPLNMIAVGITLKSLYPKLFRVTCVAHLLHNCAMKIKSHFVDVDQLIAKVKAVTIKNKTRQAKFSAIGYLPQPVPTRWGSWLNVVLYYVKKLPKVKAIVEIRVDTHYRRGDSIKVLSWSRIVRHDVSVNY